MSAWFNPSTISAYTLAKASQLNGLFQAVQVAFDKLPAPSLIQQNKIGYVVDTGAINALAVAMPITLTSYSAGICLRVKVLNTNTGASTINVDGLGAVAIKRSDGTALVGAELLAGSVIDLTYDGTVFRLPPVIVALTAGDIASITSGLAANYEPKIAAGLSSQYWRGDKIWATLDKAAVGLANVDNTSDANKPVSTAQQTQLDLKANLAGAPFTGAVTITGSPSLLLTVDSYHANGPYFTFLRSGAAHGDIGSAKAVIVSGALADFALTTRGANNLIFGINTVEKMRLDSSGRLGIGLNSPSYTVQAKGDLCVIPAATPATLATAGMIFAGESTNNSQYRLEMGYWNDGSIYRGAIQAIAGGAGARIDINALGGYVSLGDGNSTISFCGDGNFTFYKSAGNPVLSVDINDYLYYDRATNIFSINIAGNSKFSVNTNGPSGITQSAGDNSTRLATTAFVKEALDALIPVGMIMQWSGSIASIPAGWHLCDGTGGTPNLMDKFIVGAGSAYPVAATGGSKDAVNVSHTHTASVTDPGHQHNLPGATSSGGTIQTQLGVNSTASNGQSASATTGVTVGISTDGVSGTDKNLPPYYALAYIMKV